MPAASPSLRRPAVRRVAACFVQAALRELASDVAGGAEVPMALDARAAADGPALYDYRPLYRAFTEARADRLETLADYRQAIDVLAEDPAVLQVARSHAPNVDSDEAAIRTAILLPLVVGSAEGAGDFSFDDAVFDQMFDRMLNAVAQECRSFTAFAPLIGVRGPDAVLELGQGVRARRVQPLELAESWPECQGLLPERYGLARDRLLGLELDVALSRDREAELPDATRRVTRAVLALRLVLGGPVATGACLFERLDWEPRAVRAMPASVAAVLPGEPVRLEASRVALVRALADRIAEAETRGGAVAVALGRWSAASGAPVAAERAAGLAACIEPLLGADGAGAYAVAMRAAALVGSTAAEREEVAAGLRAALRLARPDAPLADVDRLAVLAGDVARSVLVAALDQGADALALGPYADAVLLGARPRPQVVVGIMRTA